MAITRLLLSRTTTLPSSTRGLIPARWHFHSSSYLMNPELLAKKETHLPKEEASSVKKTMGTQREVFSEVTEVQHKVGFPWNKIKSMFSNVKDKVFRNHESQDLSNGPSGSLQNPGVQEECITPCDNLHNAESDSVVQCTEAISGGQSEKQTDLTKSSFRKENQVSVRAISDIVKAVYPEDSKHISNLDTNGDKENKIRSSESSKVSQKELAAAGSLRINSSPDSTSTIKNSNFVRSISNDQGNEIVSNGESLSSNVSWELLAETLLGEATEVVSIAGRSKPIEGPLIGPWVHNEKSSQKQQKSNIKTMGTQREVFSEVTEVQHKVGFPWNKIKSMFSNVKDKVFRNHESQDLSNGPSGSLQNPGVQEECITPCDNLHNAESDSVVQCTEAISGGQSEKQTDLTKSSFRKENQVSVRAISDIVKAVYPEDSKHISNLDTNGDKENKIRSSESSKVSQKELAAAGSLRINSSPDSTSTIKNSNFVRSISNDQGNEIVSNGESLSSNVSWELLAETLLGEATEVVSIAGRSKPIEGPLIEQSSVRSQEYVLSTKIVANNKATVVLGKGKSKEGKFFSEGHAMSVVNINGTGKIRHSLSDWLSRQMSQTPSKCISMGVSEEWNKSNTIKGVQIEEEVKDMLKVLVRPDAPKQNTILIPEKTPSPKDYSDIIPSLVGDPDVPKVLVKNPTRTLLIKHLSNCIRLRHLKEALAFCGCSIASISFGAANSVAYVEFETEDAKERAIARHSIEINGVQLTILRIDAPRTSVVRLSTSDLLEDVIFSKVMSSCFPDRHPWQLISSQRRRSKSVLDVTFTVEQWPNMLSILNRLNGLVVDDVKFTALPAPVYPPEILRQLWRDPVERRGVLAVMRRLQTEVHNQIDSCGLNDLLGKYHGENMK